MIKNGVITNENDWHHVAFNQDYYVIGNHVSKKWAEKHEVDVFEGIEMCQKWEKEVLGEISKTYSGWQDLVSMLVYIVGEELFAESYPAETVEELEQFLRENYDL